jgi:hypothetical protein
MMPFEKGLKTGQERWVKRLWLAGLAVWGGTILVLLQRLPEAQTYSQASLGSMRLGTVAFIGVFWSLSGAWWLRRLRSPAS